MIYKKGIKWVSLSFYILLLCWMVDFKIGLLIHPKSLLIVIIGTLFLTFSKYHKGITLKELLEIGKWHSLITGMLLSFLMNITTLSTPTNDEPQLLSVALNFRPLFYSMIIYLILIGQSKKDVAPPLPQQLLVTEASKLRLKLNYQLTQREFEIATLLLAGENNQAISTQLVISDGTTKKHISNIYKKCQVSSRDQLYMLTCQLSVTTDLPVDGKA